jgi:hypothetical protein
MSGDNGNITFSESPASWNTRYITTDGFTCQLTLRAESGKELLEKANSALAYLREQGCIPFFGYSRGNGGQESESNHESHVETSTNDNHLCPIHEVEMKKWEKDGKVWYSHKTENGWCTGKAKNGK